MRREVVVNDLPRAFPCWFRKLSSSSPDTNGTIGDTHGRMHAILASLGTDGDIIPYAGLGAELRRRGHSVTLVASDHYEPVAVEHNFNFAPLISREENFELIGNPDFWNAWKTAPLSAKWGVRFIDRQYRLFEALVGKKPASAADQPVLISNPAVFAATLVHEKLGTPWANLILQPWMLPSVDAPPIMPMFQFPRWTPRPLIRGFWRILDVVGDHLIGRHLNRTRRTLGVPPARRVFSNWLSKDLVLGMFPDWFGNPPGDWPPQVKCMGFPIYDGTAKTELSSDIIQFCESGPPPIVITFGSGMMHAHKLFEAAARAAQQGGWRAIFLTRYRDQLPRPLPDSALVAEFAPFQALFPRCAAVVHHGGIGTLAKCFVAGIPQLICPIAFDQMDNAARVKALGGGDFILASRATPERIEEALRRILDGEFHRSCRELPARISAENAIGASADLIEKLAAGTGGHKKER
jgi:rhamnosyltransferase subunit B